jgi:hypothetical protein
VFNSLTVTKEQVWDEETLPDFPPPDIVRKKIEDQIANIKWLDSHTGQIHNSDFQGQFLIGNDGKVVYFRIVGGKDPLKLVMDQCFINKWISYTPENELFLNSSLDTMKYWEEYKAYKGMKDDVFYKNKIVRLD